MESLLIFFHKVHGDGGEMIAFLSALRNIGDVLGSALIVFIRKDFFILIMFLREQSWRNSFAMKRGGKSAYFLSQSSRRIGEMIAFLSALRNIGNCEDVKLKYFAF